MEATPQSWSDLPADMAGLDLSTPVHRRRNGRSRCSMRRRILALLEPSASPFPLFSGPAELMAEAPHSWSDLPADLAGLILGRLCAHADRVRFAVVCPQWRSAARQIQLPPPPPLLALKVGGTFYSMPQGEPLRFAGCDEHFATASGSWLVYRRVYCLVLVNPFSGATMTLPDPSSARGSNDEGDDSDNEGDDSEDGYDSSSESHLKWIDTNNFQVMKLIVCSPDLIAALFWSSQSYQVAVCRPGGSTWSVAWNLSLWITDIAFYKADFGRSRWDRVMNLEDDQALFLGPCSRAVCLPQHESPGNRVWFLDDYKDYYPSWKWSDNFSSDTCDLANRKFASPLPMISWSGRGGPADHVGAAWLFPSN